LSRRFEQYQTPCDCWLCRASKWMEIIFLEQMIKF
jgi:hypothetical protein